MARRARTLWHQLEDESGEELLVECGMAWFAQREDGWEAASERVFAAQGIPCERLAVAEASELYPSFRSDDLAFLLLEPEAGVLRAERSIRTLAAQAVAHGARLVRGRARPDGAAVVLEDSTGSTPMPPSGVRAVAPKTLPGLRLAQGHSQELLFFDGGPGWRRPGIPAWCDYDFPGTARRCRRVRRQSCDRRGRAPDRSRCRPTHDDENGNRRTRVLACPFSGACRCSPGQHTLVQIRDHGGHALHRSFAPCPPQRVDRWRWIRQWFQARPGNGRAHRHCDRIQYHTPFWILPRRESGFRKSAHGELEPYP